MRGEGEGEGSSMPSHVRKTAQPSLRATVSTYLALAFFSSWRLSSSHCEPVRPAGVLASTSRLMQPGRTALSRSAKKRPAWAQRRWHRGGFRVGFEAASSITRGSG